jgi:hypothetical protein
LRLTQDSADGTEMHSTVIDYLTLAVSKPLNSFSYCCHIAAGGDMIDSAAAFDSKEPCHDERLPGKFSNDN